MLVDLRTIDGLKRAEYYPFEFCGESLLLNVETSRCYRAQPGMRDLLTRVGAGERVSQALRSLSATYPRSRLLDALSTLLDWGFFYDEARIRRPPSVAIESPDSLRVGGVNVNVTHACNLRCTYCYGDSAICPSGIGPHFGGPEATMSLRTARRAVDFLVREGDRHIQITFFGGEPLLNRPAMDEFAEFARRATQRYGTVMDLGLFTNGTLVDDKVVEFLNRYRTGATVSVDGPPEAHDKNRPDAGGGGTWHTVMEGVGLLRDGLRYGKYEFRGSFTKTQVEDGISFLDYLRVADEHGAASLWAVPIVQAGCRTSLTEEHLPYLRREFEKTAAYLLERFRQTGSLPLFRDIVDRMAKTRFVRDRPEFSDCGCALGFICPAPDGSLYGCHQMTGLPEWRMGHVFGGFSRERSREVCANARVSQTCPECGLRYFCGLGCLKNKINATGDPYQPDRSVECALLKMELEAAFYLNSQLPLTLDARTFQHIWGVGNETQRRLLGACH